MYDSANQLVRENNQAGGFTHVWVYDNAGNILSRTRYAYTTGVLGSALETVNYSYGDSQWGDLLTGYGDRTITSDPIGNTLSDGKRTYTWEHGRELAALTQDGVTWTHTYNADGLRTKRASAAGTYEYVYYGGSLSKMTVGSDTLYFTYDASGMPVSLSHNGTTYFYITNLQGDVVAMVDTAGNPVVQYTYDTWGNPLSTTGTLATTIGMLNPLRYHGYVYDVETGLYYVSSRYYDPEIGRWINADDTAYLGADGTLLSYNLFAYCKNNPVMGYDPTGHFSWNDLFNTAAVVTVAAIAVIAIIASGGTAAPPLLAAASALAGTTVTAAAATTVATGVAITGIATMGAAATASILESSSKQGKDYVQARNNKQANQWAQEVGYDGAEELKADYVGKQGSKFNMYTDRATGQIILIALKTAKEIATQLFRW